MIEIKEIPPTMSARSAYKLFGSGKRSKSKRKSKSKAASQNSNSSSSKTRNQRELNSKNSLNHSNTAMKRKSPENSNANQQSKKSKVSNHPKPLQTEKSVIRRRKSIRKNKTVRKLESNHKIPKNAVCLEVNTKKTFSETKSSKSNDGSLKKNRPKRKISNKNKVDYMKLFKPENIPRRTKSPPNFFNSILQNLSLGRVQSRTKRYVPLEEVHDLNFIDFSKVLEHKINITENMDSEDVGYEVFQWILGAMPVDKFFENHWERTELLLKNKNSKKFDGLFSTSELDFILRENSIQFTKNIDVTSYTAGKRETHNPEGRALAPVVWDFYNSGCSVRFLNPQTYSETVWVLLSRLQDYFSSFCGANVYLTPPGTQGFAPHWDDIEAFILQLEGKKRWRVYEPRNLGETLPRTSSGNFGPGDPLGTPIIDTILEPGDVLYFPRGFIHQGEALDDVHSLHITLSTYQKNSWTDLLEKFLPLALAKASAVNLEFREGLPRTYMRHSGVAFSEKKNPLRKGMKAHIKDLVSKLLNDSALDEAIDQVAKGFIHDSLPPYLGKAESMQTIFEGGERWCPKSGEVVNQDELEPETCVRLIRKGCVRLIVEEKTVRLYYTMENSREYHAEEPKYLEIDPKIAPALQYLINVYPEFVAIEDFPLEDLEDKMALANGLWEKGLLKSNAEIDIDSDDEEFAEEEELSDDEDLETDEDEDQDTDEDQDANEEESDGNVSSCPEDDDASSMDDED